MKLQEAIKLLKGHNEWRRDDEVPNSKEMVDPKDLGEAIDLVVKTIENIPTYEETLVEKHDRLRELNKECGGHFSETEKLCFESGFTRCHIFIAKKIFN